MTNNSTTHTLKQQAPETRQDGTQERLKTETQDLHALNSHTLHNLPPQKKITHTKTTPQQILKERDDKIKKYMNR